VSQKSLAGTPHYEILDGLRGIAAIMVVVFHCYEILIPDFNESPVAHGYLAVDFFFCLSGFVIAYAYDSRIHRIGKKRFFINRLIRLHPLVVLGTIVGLLGLLLDPLASTSAVEEFGWGKIAVATICSVLMIPYPYLGRYGNVFPLNAPAWSLGLEYVINIFYALVLVHINKKLLTVLLAIAAVSLVWVTGQAGNVCVGWSGENYWEGYARVSCCFLAGVAVYRFGWVIPNKLHFIIYAALLMGVFFFPHRDNDILAEMLFVILLFPLIIAFGAGTVATGWVSKLCAFLGDISYPLYMLHYWMIWILGNYAATNPGQQSLYIYSGVILVASVVLAWTALKFIDEPVRKWLTINFKSRSESQ
jgi:Predicted acyltransferases